MRRRKKYRPRRRFCQCDFSHAADGKSLDTPGFGAYPSFSVKLKSRAALGLACALLWAGAASLPAQDESAPDASQVRPVSVPDSLGGAAAFSLAPQFQDQSLDLGLLGGINASALPTAAATPPMMAAQAFRPAPAAPPAEHPVRSQGPRAAARAAPKRAAQKQGALYGLEMAARRLSKPGASQTRALSAAFDDAAPAGPGGSADAVPGGALEADVRSAAGRFAGDDGALKISAFVRGALKNSGLSKDEAAERIYSALPEDAPNWEAWIEALYNDTGHAWAPSRFRNDDIVGALEHVRETPTHGGKDQVSAMAQRLLHRRGVAYSQMEKNRFTLMPNGSSPLNRFAAAMKKSFGVEVEFWADKLVDLKAGAYYSSSVTARRYVGGKMGLPAEAVASGRPFAKDDAQAAHEIVHAVTRKRRYQGDSDPIHGWLENAPALKDDPNYAKYLSLDELDAYDVTQRVLVAKAQAAYERRERGLPAPSPVALLEQARHYLYMLRSYVLVARAADKELAAMAGRLRAGEGKRIDMPGGLTQAVEFPDGTLDLWSKNGMLSAKFSSGLEYVFPLRNVSIASPSDAELAAALERQAEGLDDIARTLAQASHIRAYEQRRRETEPWLFQT